MIFFDIKIRGFQLAQAAAKLQDKPDTSVIQK